MTTGQRDPVPAGSAGVAGQSTGVRSDALAPLPGGAAGAVPNGAPTPATSSTQQASARPEPWLAAEEAGEVRARWAELQVRFVDEPRASVQRADELAARVIRRLNETFDEERHRLQSRWSRGDDVSTEELRVALQRYRAFCERLLAT